MYSYADNVKKRFYLLRQGEKSPQELLYRKALKNLEETSFPIYQQQLTRLTIERGLFSAQMERDINSLAYLGSDLKKFLRKLNSRVEAPADRASGKTRKSNLFVAAGVTRSKLNYSGENLVTVDGLKDAERDNYVTRTTESYLPRFSTGIDLFVNPSIQKLIIRLEASATKVRSCVNSYYKYSAYTDYETNNTYTLAAWDVALTPQLIYNFYNTTALKIYAGAGASFNHLYASKNLLYRKEINSPNRETRNGNYFILRRNFLSGLVRSGVRIHQNIEFSLLWGNPQEYTDYGGSQSSIKGGLFAAAITYSFGK